MTRFWHLQACSLSLVGSLLERGVWLCTRDTYASRHNAEFANAHATWHKEFNYVSSSETVALQFTKCIYTYLYDKEVVCAVGSTNSLTLHLLITIRKAPDSGFRVPAEILFCSLLPAIEGSPDSAFRVAAVVCLAYSCLLY